MIKKVSYFFFLVRFLLLLRLRFFYYYYYLITKRKPTACALSIHWRITSSVFFIQHSLYPCQTIRSLTTNLRYKAESNTPVIFGTELRSYSNGITVSNTDRLLNSSVHKRENYDQIRTVVSMDLGIEMVAHERTEGQYSVII